MDDISEQMEIADEISESLAQPLGNSNWDEDDLEKELESLEAAQSWSGEASSSSPSSSLYWCASPTLSPRHSRTTKMERSIEDEEFAALEADMAIDFNQPIKSLMPTTTPPAPKTKCFLVLSPFSFTFF